MGPITAWLGVGAAAALLVALLPRRRPNHDDVAAAYVLVMEWVTGAGARYTFGDWTVGQDPAYLYVGPISDVVALGCMVYLARRNAATWLCIIVGLAAFQLLCHVAYGLSDKTLELRDTYKLTLNVSFAAKAVCAPAPGGLHGVRNLLDRLRRRRDLARAGVAR